MRGFTAVSKRICTFLNININSNCNVLSSFSGFKSCENMFQQRIAVARLAQSVEHETLNLGVVGSSPTLGVNTFKGKMWNINERLYSK